MARVFVMVVQYLAASSITYFGMIYVVPPTLLSFANLINAGVVVIAVALIGAGVTRLRPDMAHSVKLGIVGAALAIAAAELLIYGFGKTDLAVPYAWQPAMSIAAAIAGYWLAGAVFPRRLKVSPPV